MKQYIDKSALVAEIKKYISNYKGILNKLNMSRQDCLDSISSLDSKIDVLQHILSFLNTLETKEVDLDESARHYLLHEHISPLNEVLHQADLKMEMQYHKDIEDAYKSGFELGIKSKEE